MVEERELHKLISETMTDGLLELDLQGKIVQANPAALVMLGYTREEIIRKTHRDVTPAKWHQQESQTIQEATLSQGQPVKIEQEYLRQNGSSFPAALKPVLLTDAGKKPIKILIFFQDLTSQKEQGQLQQTHLRQLNSLSLITRKLQENGSIEQTIHFILEALVAAMTHSHLAVPLIALEDETFSTNKYSDDLEYGLTTPLYINGREAGEVTVYYSENKPFVLPDEQNILDTVASALGIWLSLKSANQELADFEDQYRTIFDAMADGFALYEVKNEGQELIVADWNRAAEKMYNLLRHDILGQDIKKFFPALGKTDIYKAIVECARTGEAKILPLVHYEDDQRSQYMHNIIYGVGDRVAVIFRDVTEEEKIRRELVNSEQKFRSLIEGSAEAIYLHTPDLVNPRFVDINQSACQMLHYTRDELLALGPAKIDSPEYAALVQERMAKVLQDGKALFESEHITKEGQPIPVEINISVVEVSGQKYILSFVRDITERKQVENVLQESEERFRNLSDLAPAGIFFLNMQGEVVYVNKRLISLSGMSFDECLGHGWRKLIHPEEQEQVLKIIEETMSQGKEFSLKFRILNKQNEIHWVHSRIKMMVSAKNQPTGFIGIVEDVTDMKKAETELTNQLAFIQQLLETIPNPVFYKDINGIYLGCNQSFERFLGQSKETVIGKSVFELSPKDLAETYHQKDQELLNHPGTQIYESSIQQADGTRRAVIFDKATYNSPDGTVAGLIGVITDISESKKAADELRKQQQELSTILDSTPALIFYKDKENNFVRVNQAMAKSMSLTKKQLEGKSLFDIYPREEAEQYWQDDKAVMASGQPKLNIVEPMQTKEGIKWVQTDKIPYKNEQSEIIGIVGFAVDVTERKKAEEALRVSEYSYRLLAENATDVIWTVDMQMKPTYMSPSITRLVGYSVEEAMKRSMAEAYSPRSYELAKKIFAEELAREKEEPKDLSRSRVLELELNHKNGSVVMAEVVFNFLRDPAGQPQGILAIARDITERNRMNAELQKKMKELERFNKVTLEREKRIIELKKKLKELEQNPHG
ncbi:MAG: PAS domain S-box protein [bacterium]|nr:PAS domain S-box protein [bacterium]